MVQQKISAIKQFSCQWPLTDDRLKLKPTPAHNWDLHLVKFMERTMNELECFQNVVTPANVQDAMCTTCLMQSWKYVSMCNIISLEKSQA